MLHQFKNFASSVISNGGAGVLVGDTIINLLAGGGAKFPVLTAGQYFFITIYQKSGLFEINHEIMKVTARAGDALTVVRAQDGTVAQAFVDGDPVELRFVSASMDAERAENDIKNVALAATVNVQRHQTFTAGGNFTVPAWVTEIFISGHGAAGGGASGGGVNVGGDGGLGGAAGSVIVREVYTVTPAAVIAVAIGTGGVGAGGTLASTVSQAGGTGGTTTVGALLSIVGGAGGGGSNGVGYGAGSTGGGSVGGAGGAAGSNGTYGSVGTGNGGGGGGGGGTGGNPNGAGGAGGNGAPGKIVIEW